MMSVEDRLKAAARHKAAGDGASAVALVESVLDISPGHDRALSLLAELHLEAGNGDQALKLLEDALSRDPANCDARTLLATVLLSRGKPDEARRLIEDTLALDPTNSRACILRADIHAAENEHERAEQLLRGALAERPDDASLLSALAGLFASVRQNRAALQAAQAAMANAPDDARIMARLGCVLAELGDHHKAVPYLEKAHLKLPTDPLVMLYLAESQAATGMVRDAGMLAKRLTIRFPGLLAGWLLLIRIEAQRGDTRQVFADFLSQVKKHPDKSAALISLAMAYRSLGYLSKPIRLLRPFLENNSKLSPQHRTQALAVLRDCMLASDNLAEVGQTIPPCRTGEPVHDMPVGAPEDDTDPVESALRQNDLLVDPALSSLDALVLLRFVPKPAPGQRPRRIFGAAHLAPIAELTGHSPFEAVDSAPGLQALANAERTVSLTSFVKLPPDRLQKCRCNTPYIQVPPDLRRKWQDALRDFPRPLVALAWDGSRPGLMIEDYQPLLAALEGFGGTFLSVMWDDARHQLAACPDVIDCGKHFETLSDLGALLTETDLLIGPDGLPTHVAGALGRPATVLSQPAHPWYWHAQKGRSTWYPSVQVLKSRRFGHWTSLMEDLTGPLAAAVADLGPVQMEFASG